MIRPAGFLVEVILSEAKLPTGLTFLRVFILKTFKIDDLYLNVQRPNLGR